MPLSFHMYKSNLGKSSPVCVFSVPFSHYVMYKRKHIPLCFEMYAMAFYMECEINISIDYFCLLCE